MRIAIDLTSLSYHLTGIERYAMCISESMIRQDQENEYILVFRNGIHDRFKPLIDEKRVRAKILTGDRKQVLQLWILPRELKQIPADCYLFFAGRNPLLFRKKKIYCTIHDLVCWDYPSTTRRFQRIYSKIANRNAARVSERLFTVSEFSRERIHERLKYPLDKITVTYNGISDSLQHGDSEPFENIREKYHLPDKYIMNLSTLEPRKNLSLLLKSFDAVADKVNYDVVLVGRKGWTMDDFLQSIRANQRVHITGFVEDREVAQIYRHAMCFVFTSVYEGFGIPPIEALSFGTPVLSSDAASLPEILRDQAEYFESENQAALQEKLISLEKMSATMPRELDEFQKMNFRFDVSARKILETISQR